MGRAGPIRPPVRGVRGVVACGHPLGSAAALEAFAAGGTAMDAAVAAAAALWVVIPNACGVGGDALFLVDPGGGEDVVAFNGFGVAPAGIGDAVPADGGGTVSVPGAVAAVADGVARFGRLELGAVLAPAVRLAADGFPVGELLLAARDAQRGRLERTAAGWGLLDAGPRPGARWRQPELARTLEAIAQGGPDAFYRGPLAAAIARAAQEDGGRLAEADLAAHRTVVRAPVRGRHRGAALTVQPPASQALLALMALAAVAAHAPADGPQRAHLTVEAIEAAFAHRDAVVVEGEALLERALELDPLRAGRRGGPRGANFTTAVTTADGDGTVVSMLVTVFEDFGSAVLVPEGGFVLTDRLLGFSRDPGSPNAPAPGRHPVHTLSPTLVAHDGLRFALATPGADGQVQTLTQVIQALVDDGLDLPAALARPRWRSREGVLEVEEGMDVQVVAHLEARGHAVERHPDGDVRFGSAAVAGVDEATGTLFAVPDPRREVHAACL